MQWVTVQIDNPPAVGSVMVRQGHGGSWEPYHPALDKDEPQAGILDKVVDGGALILVSGEYPRENVGLHLEDAQAAGLLKDIAFTEPGGE